MQSDLQVVYKAHRNSIDQVMRYLRSRKCHPVAIDDPSAIVEQATKGQATIRIAVPSSEAQRARNALVEMEISQSGNVAQLDRWIKRDVFRFVAVFVVVGLGLFFWLHDLESTIQWGSAISLAITLLWSNWRRIRAFLMKGDP